MIRCCSYCLQHKAKVQRERIELREELKKEYHSKRRAGTNYSVIPVSVTN